MKVKKINSVVKTRENENWHLNRKLRKNNAQAKIKERVKSISNENQKLFQRLYSIVSRPHPILAHNGGNKGPNTLNKFKRRSEMKRIMKWNKGILRSIQEAKPSVSIKALKRRFQDTERYKTIASSFNEYGPKEDPVERKMQMLYYDTSPSPKRKIVSNSISKSSFNPKSKRHQSTDIKRKDFSVSHPYSHIEEIHHSPTKSKRSISKLNNSSILPYLEDWKGKFISVNQFNSMVSNEMTMIRKFKRKNRGLSSVQQVFKQKVPSLGGFYSNSFLTMV